MRHTVPVSLATVVAPSTVNGTNGTRSGVAWDRGFGFEPSGGSGATETTSIRKGTPPSVGPVESQASTTMIEATRSVSHAWTPFTQQAIRHRRVHPRAEATRYHDDHRKGG